MKWVLVVFLMVQEGCDKFCMFCVVFYICGVEVLCFVEQIVNEVKCMVVVGVCEVILFGQNVNVYYGEMLDGSVWGLGWLLCCLLEIDGLDWLCYMMSYLWDMDSDFIEVYCDLKSLMFYLYLLV